MTAAWRVAILAKAPQPGQAKTRLAPALGLDGAAALAERLLGHAVAAATAAAPGRVTVWAAPDTAHPAFARAQRLHGVALAVQPAGDLGRRMAHAFEQAFAASPAPVLLIGSDMPALAAERLRAAAAALPGHDAVFVPSLDGGYGLVGLSAAPPRLLAALFEGMAWSTPQVMAETRARLAAAGARHAELPALPDIDTPADLAWLPDGWLAALR
jgi:rSAM/selenodomain-associated transferase 1